MMESVKNFTEARSVLAILEGGPTSIPSESRIQLVGPYDEKVKLPYYGGHEHFERTGGFDENGLDGPVVFRWTMRTKLAE
jgi:hypothetical protein